jgi:hypothetical protein
MAQKIYTYRFPLGATIDNHVLGPQDLEDQIKHAAKVASAKIDKNRTSGTMRTMKVRLPTEDSESIFKLACPPPTDVR